MHPLLTALHPSSELPDPADALRIGGDQLSRAELLSAAREVARTLPPRGPVAVLAEANVGSIAAIVACVLEGLPVVPIPVDSGRKELEYFLRDSRATHWIGPRPHDNLPLTSPASACEVAGGAAMVFYTSGTTGAPKGVLLSAGALAAGIDALAEAWQWTSEDTVVHGLPLFHVHGLVLGVLGSLRIGSKIVHTGSTRPSAYAAAAGTMYFGVPTIWSRIADDPDSARKLGHARLLVSGSAPLPHSVFSRLHRSTGLAPVERYGMSETLITLSTRADGERRPGWVGLPLAGVQTRLRAENGELIEQFDGETVGRLEVRGPTLFDGYLGRPAATAASWTDDGWFVTGDLAARDEAGMHRIVGRESVDLIKSGGYRIGAGEVEAALLDHPSVAETAVIGIPDDDLGQRIVAYVVVQAGARQADEQALIEHGATALSAHKRPRQIRFVDSLPRNAMGKVQKQALLTEHRSTARTSSWEKV